MLKTYLSAFILMLGFVLTAQEITHKVIISTTQGNITIKLYNETPQHRDEFLRLVNSHHYDGTLFYRVIQNFVIQAGSSDSRNAPTGKAIGYGTPINIDAEFNGHCFHKQGALCAPRQPADVNHFKMSDVSQFYIVKGKKYTNDELDLIEKATNNPIMIDLKKQFYLARKPELDSLRAVNPGEFNILLNNIKDQISFHYSISNKKEFSDEQRQAYTTIGGTPELDGEYTVFGEVIEGMDVVNKIAALKVDANNRPYSNVVISVKQLK